MKAELRTDARRLAIFTICSNNYMPFAHVLLSSARHHHPEAVLFLCLADRRVDGSGIYSQDWTVIEAADLAIPDFKSFAFRYDIMEFNTALKPFMFLHLLEDRGFDEVIYFDPDIELFAPVSPITTLLREGASFVFTPHLCTPNEKREEPNDLSIMRAGTYNLGFLAVSNTVETTDLINWWARRLRYQCINAQAAGIFVDQKFMDLIPSFAARAAICRHTALNVAYWNLEQRKLDHTEAGWLIDGVPLIFFHFSGFDPYKPNQLSKHDPRFRGDISKPLQMLINQYAERLVSKGHGRFAGAAYAYRQFSSGTPIHPIIRTMFREWHAYWGSDPFEDYEAFLHQAWPGASHDIPAYRVTNLMRFLQGLVPSLSRLDPGVSEDAITLVHWFINDAVTMFGLDTALIEPAVAKLGRLRPSSSRITAKPLGSEMDVSLVAPLQQEGEVGQSARLTFQALITTGLAVELRDLGLRHGNKQGSPAPVEIIYQAAADMEATFTSCKPEQSSKIFRILVPFGNGLPVPTSDVPIPYRTNEIWAPSRFLQLVFAGCTDCPVIHMPLPISIDADLARLPSGIHLPKDQFTVLSLIGELPDSGHADAQTTIRAFRSAFPRRGQAFLVLAAGSEALSAEARAALAAELDGDPDILFLRTELTTRLMESLIASCDAVLSLHKSLGTARSIGQAMLLGRPVIATDYSATRDMLTARTGFPLEYRLISDGRRSWAEADTAQAAWSLKQLAERPEQAASLVAAARAYVERHHGLVAVAALQKARLTMLGTPVP